MANLTNISSVSALSSTPPSNNLTIFLNEDGREGLFECVAGVAPTDPQQGLYVPSATSGFYWARVWDGIHGKPEWFGAVKGGPDCYLAIAACLKLCPVTLLGEGDYFISDTLTVSPYRKLIGFGMNYRAESGTGTRIVMTSATKDAIHVGLVSHPGAVNNFAKGILVRGLAIGRSQAVAPPPIGSPQLGACGVRVTFALHCRIEDVYTSDHSIGFYFNGCVRTYAVDCKAFRQTPGSSSVNDFFFGFWADGSGSYGLSGGNGSLFINDCNASIGGSPALSTSAGFYLTNAFVDTILANPEASATQFGILIDGDNTAGSNDHIDLTISNPILDSITGTGIKVLETNAYAAIEINGGYIGLTGAAAFAGMHFASSGVTANGGHIWGQDARLAGANVIGVLGIGASRLRLNGTKAIGCSRPFGFDGCDNFVADVVANNPDGGASQAAVMLLNCAHARIVAQVTGSSYPQGVFCYGTGNVKISIDPTNIDAVAMTGGATNKVRINSTSIVTPGYYTATGMPGGFGQGIHVTGITA